MEDRHQDARRHQRALPKEAADRSSAPLLHQEEWATRLQSGYGAVGLTWLDPGSTLDEIVEKILAEEEPDESRPADPGGVEVLPTGPPNSVLMLSEGRFVWVDLAPRSTLDGIVEQIFKDDEEQENK